MKKPEIVAPVGDHAMLAAAIQAGADAVYFGVKQLNMRITAANFEISELKKIVERCHKNKVMAYLAINTIIYETELELLISILTEAKKAGIDAVIAWDMAVVKAAQRLQISMHLSTQASVSNSQAAEFYYEQGIRRIIFARECSLEHIKVIKNKLPKLELETFIHGAMCVSISGRCFLSQDLFKKSANRGDCLQPCRRPYKVLNEETGKELMVNNNFILSPKDLCTLPFIDKLIEAKIDAFKIEGRSKNPEYVSEVVSCYKEAIDAYYKKRFNKQLVKRLMRRLESVYNRGFSTGFYLGAPTSDDFTDAEGGKATETKEYIGFANNYYPKVKVAELKIESGTVKIGDVLRIQGNTTGTFKQKIASMEINHKKIKEAKKGDSVAVKVNQLVRKNDRIFLVRKN
jgi:putative protease